MSAASRKVYTHIPEHPGVYLMRDKSGKLLYVGKAANLQKRVSSYFNRPQESRIEALVSQIKKIDYELTDTALEALILEAELIKKHEPPFNIREKDGKSFLFVEISSEPYSRVELVRGKDEERGVRFGPFTSAKNVRDALKILRRIFPWNSHPPGEIGKGKRPCLNAQIGLCPGTCTGSISEKEYRETIREFTLFLKGQKKVLLKKLQKEMKEASASLEFEKAERLKRRVFSLQHIHDVAFISENEISDPGAPNGPRIEGYDISNISGSSPVGVMVVFEGEHANRSQYRKFKIKTVEGINDIGMLKEVIHRRLSHSWPLPDVMLIDGGVGQARAIRTLITQKNLPIKVIGIAKGPERKRNDFYGIIPSGIKKETLIQVRDEAHRFAIAFHRSVRAKNFLK